VTSPVFVCWCIRRQGRPIRRTCRCGPKRPEVTRAKAALLLAFARYRDRSVESGLSDTGVISLVEAQKIAYFFQLAGGKAKWEFTPSHYGPYAPAIDQFISGVEGSLPVWLR
jgi:hypothetical protein